MSYQLKYEAEAKYPTQTTNGCDYKAWAKRIVYRAERRDKSLIWVQILFAYQALDMEVPKIEQ